MSEQLRTHTVRDIEDPLEQRWAGTRRDRPGDIPALVIGALLALSVVAVHVHDQAGFPGNVDLWYLKYGYYSIEAVGLVTASLLFAGRRTIGWILAVGLGAGPLVGYVLSRGPGLSGDSDDLGKWTQPDGLIGLSLEAVLIVLAALSFLLRDRGGDARG